MAGSDGHAVTSIRLADSRLSKLTLSVSAPSKEN